jgi:hypothetical protein
MNGERMDRDDEGHGAAVVEDRRGDRGYRAW